jgi:pimeloyl-ACP methyl ester carboxylesterase
MPEPGHILHQGRRIDFVVSGEPDGIPLLFVPGSFSTPVAWRAIQSALGSGYCFYATSLLGYGGTEETRSEQDCHIDREVDMVAAIGSQIAKPVHLVGHSFGGTVALAAAMQGRIEALSIVTFEANPISLLEPSHPELFADAVGTGTAVREALQSGDHDAPAVVIDYWGGPGSFAALPDVVRDYCRATVFANVLDWMTVPSLSFATDRLEAVDIPVLLARGSGANPAMVEITRLLEHAMPRTRGAIVDGASHFLISTHSAQCAALMAEFYSNL